MPIDVGSNVQVSAKSPQQVVMFSGSDKTCSMCKRTHLGSAFQRLASAFLKLAECKMNATQKLVLVHSVDVLRHREASLTALADLVSRRSGVAYSTVKWNLRFLVSVGLLIGGDATNRGAPAEFTDQALMLVEFFEQNK